MTEQDGTDELPRWSPREGLDAADLANTLEHIRRMAWMHAWGGAFEPVHMSDIANAAAQALCGEPAEAPVDMQSPEWKTLITERHQKWLDLCDNEVVALARYVDSGDADLDDGEQTTMGDLRNVTAAHAAECAAIRVTEHDGTDEPAP